MEMVHGKSRLDRTFGHHHRELKDVQEEVKELMNDFVKVDVDSSRIIQYLELHHPEHHEYIVNPPAWIFAIKLVNLDVSGGEWKQVGKHGRGENLDDSMYAHWRSGRDLDFLDASGQQNRPSNQQVGDLARRSNHNKFSILVDNVTASQPSADDAAELEDSDNDVSDEDNAEERWMKIPLDKQQDMPAVPVQGSVLEDISSLQSAKADPPSNLIQRSDLLDPEHFFAAHGCSKVPVVPSSDRTLDELLCVGDIWSIGLFRVGDSAMIQGPLQV
jgi:hypothetical protein